MVSVRKENRKNNDILKKDKMKNILCRIGRILTSSSFMFYILAVVLVSYMMIYVGGEVCSILLAKKNHVISAVVLLTPFFLLKPRNQGYAWIIIILMTFWAMMQLLYSRVYYDIMPLSSFFMVENISLLLLESALGLVRLSDIYSIILPVVLSYIIYRLFLRKRLLNSSAKNTLVILTAFVLSIIMYFCTVYYEYYCYVKSEKLKHDKDLYVEILFVRLTENTNARAYSLNGFIPYLIYQSYVYCTAGNIDLDSCQYAEIQRFINDGIDDTDNNNQLKQKNLIFIIVESLNSWCVGMNIEGKPITPILSELMTKDNTIYALNMVPQVCHGCSSDGHFIYNTGLLPIKESVVSLVYGDVKYPSIAKTLPHYYSVNIICDESHFWNQGQTTQSYGYDRLYDIEEMKCSLNADENSISDEILFRFSADFLLSLKQPFHAQLVTLNMHQPYNKLKVPPTWISDSEEFTGNVRNYLEAVHFFDLQLGKFLNSLKENGLYDNSIVVVASDHNNLNANALDGREKAEYSDMYIPMFILNADTTLHYDHVMGQVDVYPTILDVMGLHDCCWKGVGNSILREPRVCSAVTKFGDVVGDANSELVQEQHKAWEVSELLIRGRYFDKNINSINK